MILTKLFLDNEPFILVETEIVNFKELKAGNINLMYYIIEIHNTENDEIGVVTEEIDGEQIIKKFDTWSKAKAMSGTLNRDTPENLSTHIVTINETATKDKEVDND